MTADGERWEGHEHAVYMQFMTDGPDNTPIAMKARCGDCGAEWVFDATVPDLLAIEADRDAKAALLDDAVKGIADVMAGVMLGIDSQAVLYALDATLVRIRPPEAPQA